MYIRRVVGAIFAIFILCVHCDTAANYNENTKIYVPSSPQNLTANRVTAEEIHLSWAPPLTFFAVSKPRPPVYQETSNREQADQPKTSDILSDAPFREVDYWYNDDAKIEDILVNPKYRSRRDLRSHRHRKRRQNNSTETKHEKSSEDVETHQAIDMPIGVVKKSVIPVKNPTQIAYVLYYEQGVPRLDFTTVIGVQSSADVKRKNVFPSDLGMEYSKATRNLTLLNTAGVVTKVVGFRLRNLRPFTPYKIWVRAFYNFSLEGVKSSDLVDRLGPHSTELYVLTDVKPPSAPIILNLTCDNKGVKSSDLVDRLGPHSTELYVLTDVKPPSAPIILNLTCDNKDSLFLQWRQPLQYNNSIDQYVVTLRKLPEQQPRTKLTLPTDKNDIETTIQVKVDLSNSTQYEVRIYAVTQSVARANYAVNGSEAPPEGVSSDLCIATSSARAPAEAHPSLNTAALVAALLLLLLAAVLAIFVYWRCRSRLSKCLSAAYNYLEEGGERAARAPLNSYKKPVVTCSPVSGANAVGPDASAPPAPLSRPPRMCAPAHPALRATPFAAHVARLHADGDIGFSKEYEIVVTKSAALSHTSHHSHRPENRLKNRYLNITAYDHSRVCVSLGGRCGAAGCAGGGGGGGGAAQGCDYVNANFIDGMLPRLTPSAIRRIRRKLDKRNRPNRQPSIKPTKPPPNLAEGIESAFLNIEFSGIVESDEQNDDSDSERSDEDTELDDVYVDIDGEKTRVNLEWLIWRRRYIATQGPTPATLDAFWRMIWQHRVHTVVMITNLVERGRRKCDMYWPDGGRGSSASFGGVHVTLEHEDVRAAYTVRRLRVRPANGAEPLPTNGHDSDSESPGSSGSTEAGRSVVQYHYTVWPDHGTPRHPLAVLPFVRAASADAGTVLVHCSAGVGRTGTYIVLDAQLNQLKLTGTLSPLGFLCRARTQRNHLVQTEEQYVFVHDSLLEHVRSGNTEVEFSKAREYLAKLLEPISEDELAVLDLNQKSKSMADLTAVNGNATENGDTASIKSQSEKEIVENGSQMSFKTEDLNDSKSSLREEDSDVKEVNGINGEETEGVYDLAPRTTDTYSKKMQAYNSLSEAEKEEIRKVNRAENYALLERMRSLANKHHSYQGPPPVNLLEKQFLLISRSCVEPSVCARAAHNVEKNRLGGVLPSDSARVMLVPKPGVEGSEYVNASWVCGRRRLREFAAAQHPPAAAAPDLWRLLWDHTAQLVLLLTDMNDPECEIFWPTEEEKELFIANFKASFISKETYVAYRKSERKQHSPVTTPTEPETNGLRRQESDCADDERLIPENSSPISDNEPEYRFDRTELRLERLSTGNRDLSARKSIANGDLFSSLSDKRNGPRSPRSPSKMSLKNFKISSPTKFKFPDWGSKTAGSPPDTAPPPPPVAPSLTVEEEAELRRPCYIFEKVDTVPESIPSDRVIEVINVSVHSLQDDYQLSVKFIKCSRWLEGNTTEYSAGKPDENEYVKAVREAASASEREDAIDRLIEPYKDSFALIEFVAGAQMEYKNGPVVVVDKYGGWKTMSFCTLSAASGGASDISTSTAEPAADVYCSAALAAHARCGTHQQPQSLSALLASYAALAAYGPQLPRSLRLSTASQESR